MGTGSPYEICFISDVVSSTFGWAFKESGTPSAAAIRAVAGTTVVPAPDASRLPEFAVARDDLPLKLQALRVAGESRGIDMSPLITIELHWRSVWEKNPLPEDAVRRFRDYFTERDVVAAFAATISRLRDRVILEIENPPEDVTVTPEQRLKQVQDALMPPLPPRPEPIAKLIDAANRAMVWAGNLALASHEMHTKYSDGPPAAWRHHAGQRWEQTAAMSRSAYAQWLPAMDAAIEAAPAAWQSLRAHGADLPPGWTSEKDQVLMQGRTILVQKSLGYPWDPPAQEWSDLHKELKALVRVLATISLTHRGGDAGALGPSHADAGKPAVAGPIVDTDDLRILEKLAEHPQIALTLVELADRVKRTRKTVSDRVEHLLVSKLVTHPAGREQKLVITTTGLSLVKSTNDS